MSLIKQINDFFNTIIKREFEEVSADMLLNDEEQEMLRLRYIVGLKNYEIVNVLGCSQHKVDKTLVNIRKKLAKLPSFKKEKFDLSKATEEDIKHRCKQLNKSLEYAYFCIDAFVNKLTRKQMAQKYHLEPDTIKKYKSIRRKELLS